MRAIVKYQLQSLTLKTQQPVEMPADAKVLSAAIQQGIVFLWSLVPDTVAGPVTRTFALYSTGDIPDEATVYAATITAGQNVYQLFETTPVAPEAP